MSVSKTAFLPRPVYDVVRALFEETEVVWLAMDLDGVLSMNPCWCLSRRSVCGTSKEVGLSYLHLLGPAPGSLHKAITPFTLVVLGDSYGDGL